MKGRVQFSANGIATYFAQEGLYQFASENWGPLKVRIFMTSNCESNQSLGVAANLGITSFSDLRGKRVPYVRGAPAVNVPTEAFLACGGLTWDDVQRVNFPGYNAMWTGLVNNKVDAAYANTVSGPARKAEASPRGLFWGGLLKSARWCRPFRAHFFSTVFRRWTAPALRAPVIVVGFSGWPLR